MKLKKYFHKFAHKHISTHVRARVCVCAHLCEYDIYTSVLPSISIDGDRLAASTLSCFCRSFVLSCQGDRLAASTLSCICRSFVLSCHLDRFVALSFSCIRVKLALDQRCGTELTLQQPLERWFRAPWNVKLALDLQFWQTGQFRAPVGEAQRTKQVLSGLAGAPARSGAAGRPGRHGWPAGYGHPPKKTRRAPRVEARRTPREKARPASRGTLVERREKLPKKVVERRE